MMRERVAAAGGRGWGDGNRGGRLERQMMMMMAMTVMAVVFDVDNIIFLLHYFADVKHLII